MNTGVLNTSDGNSVSTARTFIGDVTRDNTLANGTQAATGIGFRPTFVIVFAVNASIIASGSVGAGNGTLGRAIFFNSGGTATSKWVDDDSTIRNQQTAGNIQEGNITSMDTDGFTITWAKTGTPTSSTLVRFMAIHI